MSDFLPPSPLEPSFQVRRQILDGDFVRGPGKGDETYPDGWKGVLRYGVELPAGLTTSMLVSQPEGYHGIRLWWGVPPENLASWRYMAIVRSAFGHPSTPTDGQIIHGLTYRADDEVPGEFVDGTEDHPLPQGQWFYYSLMFMVGTRWYVVNTTEEVVPIDYKHRERLFELLPPFYQDTDEQTYAGTEHSMLKRWFYIIGYDLDLQRTLTEGIDTLYDPDRGSMRLLGPLGEQNLGFNRNAALGDIRYRGLLASSREIQDLRGTYGGLQTYIAATTQYNVSITPGSNLMLLGDDANFARGRGNWCPTHFGLNRRIDSAITSTRRLTIEHGPVDSYPVTDLPDALTQIRYPVSTVAKVQAGSGENEHLAMSCGAGQQVTIEPSKRKPRRKVSKLRHLNPTYRGIPVEAGAFYYFSFWIAAAKGSTESYVVRYGLAYYEREIEPVGFSDAFRQGGFRAYSRIEPMASSGVDAVNTAAITDDSWNRFVMSSKAPEGARFAVPIIWVRGPEGERIATPRYLTGLMVNQSQNVGVDAVYRPNYHLIITDEVGDTTNVIGEESGKVIGEP